MQPDGASGIKQLVNRGRHHQLGLIQRQALGGQTRLSAQLKPRQTIVIRILRVAVQAALQDQRNSGIKHAGPFLFNGYRRQCVSNGHLGGPCLAACLSRLYLRGIQALFQRTDTNLILLLQSVNLPANLRQVISQGHSRQRQQPYADCHLKQLLHDHLRFRQPAVM